MKRNLVWLTLGCFLVFSSNYAQGAKRVRCSIAVVSAVATAGIGSYLFFNIQPVQPPRPLAAKISTEQSLWTSPMTGATIDPMLRDRILRMNFTQMLEFARNEQGIRVYFLSLPDRPRDVFLEEKNLEPVTEEARRQYNEISQMGEMAHAFSRGRNEPANGQIGGFYLAPWSSPGSVRPEPGEFPVILLRSTSRVLLLHELLHHLFISSGRNQDQVFSGKRVAYPDFLHLELVASTKAVQAAQDAVAGLKPNLKDPAAKIAFTAFSKALIRYRVARLRSGTLKLGAELDVYWAQLSARNEFGLTDKEVSALIHAMDLYTERTEASVSEVLFDQNMALVRSLLPQLEPEISQQFTRLLQEVELAKALVRNAKNFYLRDEFRKYVEK